MAPHMQLFLKRISLLMSEQQDLANSVVAGWLRCRFSFALLRTTLICLRGTRKKRYTPRVDDICRAAHESRIDFSVFVRGLLDGLLLCLLVATAIKVPREICVNEELTR